jgi:hypothetical protein
MHIYIKNWSFLLRSSTRIPCYNNNNNDNNKGIQLVADLETFGSLGKRGHSAKFDEIPIQNPKLFVICQA